jgi:hypothetical protein
MKPMTKAVLLIVVMVALYFAALTLGFVRNDSENASARDEPKPSIKLLGRWTAPFAPALETSKHWCNRRQIAKGFTLTGGDDECVLQVSRRFKDRYRKLELEVAPQPEGERLEAYVYAIYKEADFPQAERDPMQCPLTKEMPPAEFRLEVVLGTNVDMDGKWDCWRRHDGLGPLRIIVTQNKVELLPTPLSLRCIGCGGEAGRAIEVRATE